MTAKLTHCIHHTPSLISAFFTCLAAPLASAADYYVDPAGNDSASGTSAATPWKTLAKVNATTFLPGDNILFKKGGTWTGTLQPQGSGNGTSQITLGSYGSGAKPLIDGAGAWAAIVLSSQSYWTIDGFEATNWGEGDSSRSGIRIGASGSQTTRRIRILNNDVRDIRGIRNVTAGARNNGAIFFWIEEPGKADDVLIEGNTVTNVYSQGINFNSEAEYMGAGMNYDNCSPNVVVRGNRVLTTSGDGILLLGTDNKLAEFNEVGYCGALSDQGQNIAAAWPTRHVGGIWQYNHIHHTVDVGNDTTAFDNDGFVKGTTYNLSESGAIHQSQPNHPPPQTRCHLAYQARRLRDDGDSELWAKPLGKTDSGDVAVTLLNRSKEPATISFTLAEIGIDAGAGYALRDLWQRKTLAQADRAASQSFTVPAHGVLALRIKGKSAATPLFAKASSAP